MTAHKLVAESVRFLSAGDEDTFFVWLKSIPCVADTTGIGRVLYISLSRSPDEAELRELVALFYRYDVDMRQLGTFATEPNQNWLRNSDGYWFKRVFG